MALLLVLKAVGIVGDRDIVHLRDALDLCARVFQSTTCFRHRVQNGQASSARACMVGGHAVDWLIVLRPGEGAK